MNLIEKILETIFVVMIVEKFGFWLIICINEKKKKRRRFWNLCNSLVMVKSRNLFLLKWW